jgi:SAM-dependent methyltransferase
MTGRGSHGLRDRRCEDVMNEDWDARYAGSERLFSSRADGSLIELVASLPPGTALDVGAGEGRNALWLAGGGWDVTAIDISNVALARLRQQAAEAGLRIRTEVADMSDYLAIGGQFDLIVVANLHPEPMERARLFAGVPAALREGGHLFLVGHHVDSLGIAGPPDAKRLYTEAGLRSAFSGLEVVVLDRREGQHGDTGHPSVDVVLWARRPARESATG